MNTKIKIGLVAVIIILFLLFINHIGALSFLNKYFNMNPNKSCSVDSDCALKKTTCEICDCGDAVNKNWNVFCPFINGNIHDMCKMCASEGHDFDVKCVNNQCQRIWRQK